MRRSPAVLCRPLLAGLAVASVAALAAGCDRPPPLRQPRLVLLYAPCTLSREYLSPYRAGVDFTPNLDRLAREGVVFRRHVSEAGQSGTAYAAMFSGTQAPVHGVLAHPQKIPESVELVSEAFADQGYETYFWGGHPLAGGEYDYGQGVAPERTFDIGLQAGDPRFGQILDRLRSDPDYRAFVMTNFTVTHTPYTARNLPSFLDSYPERAAAKETKLRSFDSYLKIHWSEFRMLSNDFPGAVERLDFSDEEVRELAGALELLYQANVHFLDRRFGEILDFVEQSGLMNESLIVFTADHGEQQYRDGVLFPWSHGWELAPEVLTVPWIVRLPEGRRAGTSYEPVTRSIDVFPTVAGLAGMPLPEGVCDGVDLAPAVLGLHRPPDLLAYSHTSVLQERFAKRVRNAARWLMYHGGTMSERLWVSIREGDDLFKYRNLDGESWGVQVFDLSQDPHASRDLFDPASERHREMEGPLREYQEELASTWRETQGEAAVDPAAEEALRALGYVE